MNIASTLKRFSLLALLAIPATAHAQIQAGTYPLEIAFGGGILEGLLVIAMPRPDSMAVTLNVGDHGSPVRIASRQGNKLVLESATPGMQLRYDLEFRGDSVVGPFTYSGDTGSVRGRRRRTGS